MVRARHGAGVVAGAAALAVVVMAGIGTAERAVAGEAAAQQTTQQAKVERGGYLVAFGGCNDCHTPWHVTERGPEPDMSRMLSGHPQDMVLPAPPAAGDSPWGWGGALTNTAFWGPWGVTYAFNLTPDENTGLGIWTEEMFVKAMREGKHMGQSRPIMPPMPWPGIGRLSDEDLAAVYAYLRSIPPISNRVPDYQPPAEPEGQPAG